MDNESKEFLVFNKPIEKFSILYGFFLLLWGIVISLISGSDSFTSYIPSILGLPIIIFSFLAIKYPNKTKLYMHITVIFGLIIFLGGLDFIRSVITGYAFNNLWADISKLMMLLSGFYFTLQCVKSFIHVRKTKSE